jgi:hypothetical protein
VTGSCEQSNEPSGSIKDEEFLDYSNDCYLLKNSASWIYLALKCLFYAEHSCCV